GLCNRVTLFRVYLYHAQATQIQQQPAIRRGVTSRVMATALNGNFEIVLPRKPDRRDDIGGWRASYDDARAAIKATDSNLARRIQLRVHRRDERTRGLGTERLQFSRRCRH